VTVPSYASTFYSLVEMHEERIFLEIPILLTQDSECQVTFFSIVMPCSLVNSYRYFGGVC